MTRIYGYPVDVAATLGTPHYKPGTLLKTRCFVLPIGAALLLGTSAFAQSVLTPALSENPEAFRLEVTGSAWILNSGGQIQANGAPIDLVSDLGVEQHKPTFYGQLVFKPGRKHRIVVEGTPFALNGLQTVNRSITYRGQVFSVSQTVRSSADMSYVFGGYQYDLLSGPKGHLGLSAGGAYLSATGTIYGVQTGITSSKTETVGLPLAGAEFRVFPIPRHKIFEIDGGLRGMAFGSYGHYAEADGNGGICLGPVIFQAGYRAVNADLHESSASESGVNARFKGPIFSVVGRF